MPDTKNVKKKIRRLEKCKKVGTEKIGNNS